MFGIIVIYNIYICIDQGGHRILRYWEHFRYFIYREYCYILDIQLSKCGNVLNILLGNIFIFF